MAYLGSWKIDDLLTFPADTHAASTGAATDADAVPSYRVYEDETGTAILTGSMAKLDDTNTTGFYSEQITLSAANGFEKGKCYTIYISAAVSSVTGTMAHTFQMEAEVDANTVSPTLNANVVQISGDTTAADNAEAFFDGTGYAGTGNTIPTVTTVTNTVNANTIQLSGDTTAADNAEAFFDGTGYAGTNNVIPTVTTVIGAVTTSERKIQGSVGLNAAGLFTAHAWLQGPDGSTVSATDATFELLDYDETSIIGTGGWTTAPTETAGNTWYADKSSTVLVEGMSYKLRVVITAGSAYTRLIPFNAVA